MCRKKYFIIITNDTSTSTIELAFLSSIETLDKIKELNLPLDCQKLLPTQFKAIQLVCDNVETVPSKCNDNASSLINWGDDYDGQNSIPVHILDSSSSLAATLHNLAGSLTPLGSYDLTIYCEGPLFNVDAITHWEVFSALLRLSVWCNGNIYHVTSENYCKMGDKWDRVIRVETNPINGEICLWKGNFIITPGHWMTQFKICYHIDDVNPGKFPDVFDAEPNLLYRVSHRLEVLQEFDINKVPLHMLYPTKLKFKSFCPKIDSEEHRFIRHVRKKSHIAILARFCYYPINDAVDEGNKTILDWNTALLDDTYQRGLYNEYPDPEAASYMNVLICWNHDIEDELSCYVIRNPDLINYPFLDKVVEKSRIPLPNDIEMAKNLFKNTPAFELVKETEATGEVCELSNEELPVQKETPRKFTLHLKKIKMNENEYLIGKIHQDTSIAQLTDPCDWPERKFLASLAKNDEPATITTKTCQSNLSLDVTKYFDKKGDSKQNPILDVNEEAIVKQSKCNEEQIKKLATMPWPQSMEQHFHDVYYNDDKSEQAENKGMELRNQLKEDETSSRDFKEKDLPKGKNPRKITTPRSRKNKTPVRKTLRKSKIGTPRRRRTPAKKPINVVRKESNLETNYVELPENVSTGETEIPTEIRKKTTPKRRRLINQAKVPTKKVIKTPTKIDTDVLDKESIPNPQENEEIPQSISIKKRSTAIKPSQLGKKLTPKKGLGIKVATNSSQAKKPQLKLQPKPNPKSKVQQILKPDLENKTIKKLREAVVTAFESRGVKMSDPLFKTCGKRLFNICKEYAIDLERKPGASAKLKFIAEANVDQVIAFEKHMSNL